MSSIDVTNHSQILINGVELPYAATVNVAYEDLHGDSTGRNINNGVLQIQRVRKDLTKIELSWKAISMEEARTIQDMLSKSVTFQVQFYSPMHGTRVTKNMYSSASSNEYISTGLGIRVNLTRNIIEV